MWSALLRWAKPGFTPGQGPGSDAVVKVLFGNQELTWRGRVVRASGTLDERTRMFEVIIRVEDPYAKKPPLAPLRDPKTPARTRSCRILVI